MDERDNHADLRICLKCRKRKVKKPSFICGPCNCTNTKIEIFKIERNCTKKLARQIKKPIKRPIQKLTENFKKSHIRRGGKRNRSSIFFFLRDQGSSSIGGA